MFGGADVGAVEQHVGCQACGQAADFKLTRQRQSCRQIVRKGLVNQHGQGIARLLAVFHGRFVIGLCGGNQSFLLAQINGGNHARFVFQLAQAVGLLAGFQNVLRQFHCFFGVAFVEIGFGHGSDNGQVDGIAGGGAVEVAFQRGTVVAARFAEEVEFVCRYAEADAVRFGDGGTASRKVGCGTLAGAAAFARHCREEVGARDAVLLAQCFGVERGGTQVGIAFQRDFNQAVQARVGKIILPAQRGRLNAVLRVIVFERFRHGNLRLFVFRNHGAAGQCGGNGGRTQKGFEKILFHVWSLLFFRRPPYAFGGRLKNRWFIRRASAGQAVAVVAAACL